MLNAIVWYLFLVADSYLIKVGILGIGIMGSQIALRPGPTTSQSYCLTEMSQKQRSCVILLQPL
jgi:hypothetical protein